MLSWRVREYDEVTSTQAVAEELARGGAPHGTVVSADRQSGGRGRFERRWLSPPGGLYISVILRPKRVEGAHKLSLVGALAAAEAVRDLTKAAAKIRWPNDVILVGKKVGGVISTASIRGKSMAHVILGIGVNCNFNAKELGGLARSSTTIREVLGRDIEVSSLRSVVLKVLGAHYDQWGSGNDRELIERVKSLLSTVGKEVKYKRIGGGNESGLAKELDYDGSLLISRGGKESGLRAEEVEWLRET